MKKKFNNWLQKTFRGYFLHLAIKKADASKRITGVTHYVFNGHRGLYVTSTNNVIDILNAKRKANKQRFRKFNIADIEKEALYIAR